MLWVIPCNIALTKKLNNHGTGKPLHRRHTTHKFVKIQYILVNFVVMKKACYVNNEFGKHFTC